MLEILCICTQHLGLQKHQKPAHPIWRNVSMTWPAGIWAVPFMALTQTSLTVACDMSVSLAVFSGNSDSEAIVRYFLIFFAGQWPLNLEVSCDTALYINFGVSASSLSCFCWNDTTERLQYSCLPEAKPSKQRPLLNLIQPYWNCTKEGFAAELKYVRLNPINQQDDCPKPGRVSRWLQVL